MSAVPRDDWMVMVDELLDQCRTPVAAVAGFRPTDGNSEAVDVRTGAGHDRPPSRIVLIESRTGKLARLSDRARSEREKAHALKADARRSQRDANALRTRAATCRPRADLLCANAAALIANRVPLSAT
jgi:hypothetical protein